MVVILLGNFSRIKTLYIRRKIDFINPEMSSNQVALIYCVVLYKVCIISCIVVFVTNVKHDDYS